MSETVLNLTIDETKRALGNTDVLMGELQGILLRTDKAVRVFINSADNPTIELLDLNNFNGEKYFPLKLQALNSKGEGFNYGHSCYYLNDSLSINIQGPIGTQITVKFRMED